MDSLVVLIVVARLVKQDVLFESALNDEGDLSMVSNLVRNA